MVIVAVLSMSGRRNALRQTEERRQVMYNSTYSELPESLGISPRHTDVESELTGHSSGRKSCLVRAIRSQVVARQHVNSGAWAAEGVFCAGMLMNAPKAHMQSAGSARCASKWNRNTRRTC